MPTVKGKEKLCGCEEYKIYFKSIQGLGGHTLFDRYDAVENVVNNYVDEKYRHFLAQPVMDGDSIMWFSKPYKDTPRRLTELQGKELAKYEGIKQDSLRHYTQVIQSLRQQGLSNEADLLEKATKFVNDDFVYCFNDKTVLGIWGMQLRDEVRSAQGVAVKSLYVKKSPPPPPPPPPAVPPPSHAAQPYRVNFSADEGGDIVGNAQLYKQASEQVYEGEVPYVNPREGYEFVGWNSNPVGHRVDGNTEFIAQFRRIPPPPVTRIPWYRRFWDWLRRLFFGRHCLKWLLWLLLLLLLLLLIAWLFRSCSGGHAEPIPYPIEEKPWLNEDPNTGKGGIYDPGNPYGPTPTPPEYSDVLPPEQGVMPPVDERDIVRDPGMPVVLGNRLNILMENADKSIMDLARDFKAKYPDSKYKVVYYDDVVKRMQIELPPGERAKLREEIPGKFAPQYELFVFDEALFEQQYVPNDPAYSASHGWYLKAIKAPEAWNITRGSSKMTIAIIDNGFSLKHPELSSKVVMPYNVWKHSASISAQQEDHGTHVAGTALAKMNNGQGICGIAPDMSFMPVQVANEQGLMTTTSVLDGILYALYQGADVLNVSLGMMFTGRLSEDQQRDMLENRFKEEERLWNEVMKIASKHKAVVVVAAGNDNMLAGVSPITRPKNFVVVSAVDKNSANLKKASFSNYGDYTTISAPGVGIYSSIGNNDYASHDGTSMAAPIVTGAVALMKSLNEDLSAEEVICILQSTGLPVGGGVANMLQLDKALQMVQMSEQADCDSRPETPSTGDVQVLLSWQDYNDLDLICVDPEGSVIWFRNKRVPSGGLLEIDMNVQPNDSNTPIENIYWQQGTAPNGNYEVYLWFYRQHEPNVFESPYEIQLKYGSKTETITGTIKYGDGRVHVGSFTLGDASARRSSASPSQGRDNADELRRERARLQQEIDAIDERLQRVRNGH